MTTTPPRAPRRRGLARLRRAGPATPTRPPEAPLAPLAPPAAPAAAEHGVSTPPGPSEGAGRQAGAGTAGGTPPPGPPGPGEDQGPAGGRPAPRGRLPRLPRLGWLLRLLRLPGAAARRARDMARAWGRAAARAWERCRRLGVAAAAPLRALSHNPRGGPPRTQHRQQRLAVRSRRLEVAALVTAAALGLGAGVCAPAGRDGVRDAQASSSIAEGVSRPGAVDAPAAAPDSGSTAGLDPAASGQLPTMIAAPLERSAPVRVRIPQLGTDAEIFGAQLAPDGGPPTPSEADAMRAAWYAGGVSPGERGAAIIVGHLDTYDGPAAFAGLGQLRPGETIEIDRADGETAVFAVDSVEQYPKVDFPDERVYGAVETSQLRLITCGGRWTPDGGYDSNIVAYAHLVPRGQQS